MATAKSVKAGDQIKADDHNKLVADVLNLEKTAAKGEKGATGAQGPAGKDGVNGKDGAQGPKGEKGDTGAKGATGPAGKDAANQFTAEQKEALLALIAEKPAE